MRALDTGALSAVARSLGIGNPASATEMADFDDGVLQQVLDVGALAGRGQVEHINAGLGRITIVNIHAGATNESTSVALFGNLQEQFLTAGWPSRALREGKLDLWITGVTAQQTLGAVNQGAHGRLSIDLSAAPSIAIDSAGAAPLTSFASVVPLYGWDSTEPFQQFLFMEANGLPFVPMKFRVPRSAGDVPVTSLTWATASAGLATYVTNIMVAFVPAGLEPLAF